MRCRGCGGNGVGQHVPPRTVQIIEAHQPITLTRVRSVEVRIDDKTPLADAVRKIRQRAGEAFLPKGRDLYFVKLLLEHEEEWACTWCHGTGVPQLSVNALERATTGGS